MVMGAMALAMNGSTARASLLVLLVVLRVITYKDHITRSESTENDADDRCLQVVASVCIVHRGSKVVRCTHPPTNALYGLGLPPNGRAEEIKLTKHYECQNCTGE
jgi:hypothetical protein